jgi:hypothetical protein
MAKLWEDIKKTVKEGVTVAVEKTEEYGKIGVVKVDILKLERDRDKAFRELGSEVYNAVKKDKALAAAQNEKMKKTVSKIDSLIKSIKAKEAEVEKIKKEAGNKPKASKDSAKPKTQSETKKTNSAAKKPQAKSTK